MHPNLASNETLPAQLKGSKPQKSSNVVSRVVAEEAIVVPIRRGAADMDSIFTFNEAGTALWNMIEQSRSELEMREHLQKKYGLSAEEATADTKAFLEDLASAGLIETQR